MKSTLPEVVAVFGLTVMLLIAAKQDLFTGEVDLWLLLLPLALFVPVLPKLHFLTGFCVYAVLDALSGLYSIRYIARLLSRIPEANKDRPSVTQPESVQKMGGADIIIFTEIALLFDFGVLIIILTALIIGLLQVAAKYLFQLINHKETSVKTLLSLKIRFIPAISISVIFYIFYFWEGFI